MKAPDFVCLFVIQCRFFCSLSTVDGLLIVEHGAGWLAGTVDAIPQRKPTRFVCLLHRLLWLGLAWIGIIESLCSALHTNEEVASSRIHFVCLLCEIPKYICKRITIILIVCDLFLLLFKLISMLTHQVVGYGKCA